MLNSITGIIGSGGPGGGIPTNFESIATLTAAGGETSLTFSSIPGTYSHLQIRGISRDTYNIGGFVQVSMQFNSDTAANYTYHFLAGDGSAAAAAGGISRNYIDIPYSSNANATSNVFGASIVDILDYASTSKYKTARAFGGVDNNAASTNWKVALYSGLWLSTSAITTIALKSGATAFAAGSTFALYGVK